MDGAERLTHAQPEAAPVAIAAFDAAAAHAAAANLEPGLVAVRLTLTQHEVDGGCELWLSPFEARQLAQQLATAATSASATGGRHGR